MKSVNLQPAKGGKKVGAARSGGEALLNQGENGGVGKVTARVMGEERRREEVLERR